MSERDLQRVEVLTDITRAGLVGRMNRGAIRADQRLAERCGLLEIP